MPNFIGMVTLSQERIFNSFANGLARSETVEALCLNYWTTISIINPGIVGSWKILKNMINQFYLDILKKMNIANRVLSVLFISGLSVFLFYNLILSIRIKF